MYSHYLFIYYMLFYYQSIINLKFFQKKLRSGVNRNPELLIQLNIVIERERMQKIR